MSFWVLDAATDGVPAVPAVGQNLLDALTDAILQQHWPGNLMGGYNTTSFSAGSFLPIKYFSVNLIATINRYRYGTGMR